MKISHWLSGFYRRLSRRERTVVAGGAVISAAALLWTYVAAPAAVRWRAREDAITARSERVVRLRGLIALDSVVDTRLVALRVAAERARSQLLEGETPTLAASNLQLLLGRYAEQSRVTLERVDVASALGPGDTLTAVPASITARGELQALVDLLFYVQHGQRLLVIDDLRVSGNAAGGALHADVTWSVALHGFYASPPEGSEP